MPGSRLEKSSFVQTCNLLSRYMKEKGSLRDLNLEIGGKVESLEAIGKSTQQSNEQRPSMAIDSSFNTLEDTSHNLTSKEVAAMNSQLTIFYLGKVLVFDECPANKAKELIAFAKKQSSQMSYGILSNTLGSNGPAATSSPREGLPPRPQASTSSHKAVVISSNTCHEKINTAVGGGGKVTPQPDEAKQSADLPIARRSSLHRFLTKRKDRAAVRGPYQYHDRVEEGPAASSSSSKGDEQLELRL